MTNKIEITKENVHHYFLKVWQKEEDKPKILFGARLNKIKFYSNVGCGEEQPPCFEQFMETKHEMNRLYFWHQERDEYIEYLYFLDLIHQEVLKSLPDNYVLTFKNFLDIVNEEEIDIYYKI